MKRLHRRILIIVALVAALVCVPAIAQAAFTATAVSTMTASAAQLTAPAAVEGTKTCTKGSNSKQLKITVTGYSRVAGANFYELRILNAAGTVISSADISSGSGSYSQQISLRASAAEWTYEIRGNYKPRLTSNTWTGQPYTGTISC